jgi:hypothetical protein
MGKGSGGKAGGSSGAKGGGSKPAPGTPVGDNRANQLNRTSPVYYKSRGLPVPSNLPSGPKPPGK